MRDVLAVEQLSKHYRLGQIGPTRLAKDLSRRWALWRGRPDPTLPIGVIRPADGSEVTALQDVGFTLREGEVLGIIGHNGAGKSTLLKILSRVTAPSAGRVRMRGRVASLLEVGTGFHPELSGRENIYLNAAMLGMTRGEVRRRFDEIVEFAAIGPYLDTPVKRYSSGMYVRLAFAVAAHLESEILIVDEVLAVGDLAFQQKCLGRMNDVARGGRTLLFVSHNLAAVRQLCPNTLWLEHGRVHLHDATAAVLRAYAQRLDTQQAVTAVTLPVAAGRAVQLLRVALERSDGRAARRFECDEPLRIVLDLDVRRPIYGLFVRLTLRRSDGETAWELESRDRPQQLPSTLIRGRHCVTVTLPARTLAAGSYLLEPSLRVDDGTRERAWDEPGALLSFSLSDGVTPRGDRRSGMFSLLPDWQYSEGDAAEPPLYEETP
jgi:lipopolysaccharide transport system ATP-binding protein